ncbi:hypothetical protein F0A17_02905 [Billgrantia pellis]|uniref:Uncharacterized protein n=1 Tax=Billgrantia pellis TaxID=2606936 RepID=A0A7V7G358_9GAMM|nr:hypothetical protein [Halomonas pellis]KAA0014609.1 hypothetical protein F0A17_02905 [Halomonas pellis]
MIEKVIKLEDNCHLWEVKYRGIPVWSYIRGVYFSQYLPYKAKVKFSTADIFAFFTFLTMRFRNVKVVFFLPAREDVISYQKDVVCAFKISNPITFIRAEGGETGNVFFIELLRFIFRKISFLFCYSEYKRLRSEVWSELSFDPSIPLRNFLGDYYFLKLIVFFLKGKKVYYTNCVVPQVERFENSLDSCELQHGVIHSEHLDYSYVPYVKNSVIVYSEHYLNVLEKIKFSGKAVVVRKSVYKNDIFFDCIIFTTINLKYCSLVDELFKSLNSHDLISRLYVKKHPRDNYAYQFLKKEKILLKASPLDAKIAILPDTSLIINMVEVKKEFIYLHLENISVEEIKETLYRKYKVDSSLLKIATNKKELLDLIRAFL